MNMSMNIFRVTYYSYDAEDYVYLEEFSRVYKVNCDEYEFNKCIDNWNKKLEANGVSGMITYAPIYLEEFEEGSSFGLFLERIKEL